MIFLRVIRGAVGAAASLAQKAYGNDNFLSAEIATGTSALAMTG